MLFLLLHTYLPTYLGYFLHTAFLRRYRVVLDEGLG